MKKPLLNITDEELCALFQEAADNYLPPYEQGAWEQVADKINNEEKDHSGRSRKRRSGWLLLLLLLSAASLGGYLYFRPAHESKPVLSGQAPASHPAMHSQHNALQTAPGPLSSSSNNQPVATIHEQGITSPVPEETTVKQADHHSNPPNTTSLIKTGKQASGEVNMMSSKENTDAADKGKRRENKAEDIPSGISNDSAGRHIITNAAGGSPASKTANPENKKGRSDSSLKNSRWSLSLTIGPDWGTVKFRQWTKPGIDGGILLSYRFSEKWSVVSGVMLTRKIYIAGPKDYNPKSGNWYNTNLQQIDANCRVIDIPLNVQYDIHLSSHNSAFVSTGLSSFWMKKEDYTYLYNNAGSLSQRSASYRNNSNHLFSIWNISAGYATKISPHFSLQAAPFIKLPLSGVGYGRVKLSSSGILLSGKYDF